MRENGYYWVKTFGEWTVAEWKDGYWWVCGNDCEYREDEIGEIGEKVERKEEGMKDTSGSVFPSKRFAVGDELRDEFGYVPTDGITLREYYAGQALIGLVMANATRGIKPEDIKRDCWVIADAVISGRDTPVS